MGHIKGENIELDGTAILAGSLTAPVLISKLLAFSALPGVALAGGVLVIDGTFGALTKRCSTLARDA